MQSRPTKAGVLFSIILALSLAILAAAGSDPFLTLSWNRIGNAPVLQVGPAGSWDSFYVIAGPVVVVGGIYRMLYTGSSGSGAYSIGLATSTDGLNWTKNPTNPVITYGQSPAVLYEDGQFRMWYTTPDRSSIIYATSQNGVTWNVSATNPALFAGPGWDASFISAGAVLHNATGYYLYYEGSSDFRVFQGGLATSQDGLHWMKDPRNPVMPANLSGSWDSDYIAPSSIIDTGTTRVIWYVGGTTGSGYQWRIGIAVSEDGIHWTAANRPVLNLSMQGGWDSAGFSRVAVVSGDGVFRMWYTGLNSAAEWQIGFAEATYSATSPTASGTLFLAVLVVGVAVVVTVIIVVLIMGQRRTRLH